MSMQEPRRLLAVLLSCVSLTERKLLQLKECQLFAGRDEFICHQAYNAEDGSFKRLSDMIHSDHPTTQGAKSTATVQGKGKASAAAGPADKHGKGMAAGVEASGKGKAVLAANGKGKAAAAEADGRGNKAAATTQPPASEPAPGVR